MQQREQPSTQSSSVRAIACTRAAVSGANAQPLQLTLPALTTNPSRRWPQTHTQIKSVASTASPTRVVSNARHSPPSTSPHNRAHRLPAVLRLKHLKHRPLRSQVQKMPHDQKASSPAQAGPRLSCPPARPLRGLRGAGCRCCCASCWQSASSACRRTCPCTPPAPASPPPRCASS